MSDLKDIVPPLELCKKIPAGEFEDSALMCEATLGMASRQVLDIRIIPRQKITNNPYVDRKLGREYYIYPAPTLQEIMAELPPYAKNEKILACCVPDWADFSARVFGESWRVGYTGNCSINDKNPATAALKLWLKMEGIEA